MHSPYPNYKGQVRYDIGKLKPGGIPYSINSMGSRGPEIDFDAPSVITLGGSNVFGLGILQEDIWPQLLADHLNLQLINLSRAAAAPDTCFRILNDWLNVCKDVRQLIYMEPPPFRHEVLKTEYANRYNPGIYSIQSPIIEQWFATDENNYLNYLKNKLAIIKLCEQNNISYLIELETDFIVPVDFGLDGAHLGVKSHKKIFEKIIALL